MIAMNERKKKCVRFIGHELANALYMPVNGTIWKQQLAVGSMDIIHMNFR